MAITATPSTVTVYPSAPSNPNGNASTTVALAGDGTGYSVSNPSPTIVSASISGSVLTIGYVASLPSAGTPITLTITGTASGLTTTVHVYSYGALSFGTFAPNGSVNGQFTVLEPGYAGTFTATIDPPLADLASSSGPGPVWGPVGIASISPGECVLTVTDDHGGAVQYLLTVYSGVAPQPSPTPLGYPTAGAWFDFQYPDADGLPTVGEIRGMPVVGVAELRGPKDLGNFAWASGAGDLISQFNVGFGDNGQPIKVTWAGKSDFFLEELGQAAAAMIKTVDNVALLLSVPEVSVGQQFTFSNVLTVNQSALTASKITELIVASNASQNAIVGTAVVGQAVIGANETIQTFQVTRAFAINGAQGNVVQVGFSEESISAWTILGYLVRLSAQEETVS